MATFDSIVEGSLRVAEKHEPKMRLLLEFTGQPTESDHEELLRKMQRHFGETWN